MSAHRPAVFSATVVAVAVAAVLAFPALALAASPMPSGGTGSDTRSPGQGPGLVGTPGLAILAVVGIALLAIALTLLYVRLTAGRASRR